MSKYSHKDFACLQNILDSIGKIKQYIASHSNADDLYNDSKSFDAVMMNFVIIGEMAEKLSDEFRLLTEAQIDWYKIRGLRNIIAHNYFGIDAEEIWQIIGDSFLDLENKINALIN